MITAPELSRIPDTLTESQLDRLRQDVHLLVNALPPDRLKEIRDLVSHENEKIQSVINGGGYRRG